MFYNKVATRKFKCKSSLRHVPEFRRVTLLICAAYECTGVVMRPEEIDLKAAEIESNSGATTHLEESPTRKA